MTLLDYIEGLVNLPAETQQHILSIFHSLESPKGHLLHTQGNTAKTLYYIEKGLVRIFYYNAQGKEITYGFYKEGDMVTIPESFFEHSPSNYSMDLLEDCSLQSISYEGLVDLMEQCPELEKIKSHFLLHFLLKSSHRIMGLQFQNAQERYENMLKRQPDIFLRAPLGYIASYLGITQETLSRIRAKK